MWYLYVNLKKEIERNIVNHKNELKENLITDIPFSVSEIKKYKYTKNEKKYWSRPYVMKSSNLAR